MTASAPIAGTLRAVPDTASLATLDSGARAHTNFRSVLEQYHSARNSDSDTDDAQAAPQQKQKDSDPTSTLAAPQPVARAAEPPHLLLPFTASAILRQDRTSSTDDTTAQDTTASPDDTATQDSTAASDPNALPSGIANNHLPSPAIFRSTLDLHSFPFESDAKTNSAFSGTHLTRRAKSQAKSQTGSKDPVPSQTAAAPLAQTAPADSSIPILPMTSSTTAEPAATVVQNGSTVSEARYTVSTSTSDHGIPSQFGSSNERLALAGIINPASHEPQTSNPTLAFAVPLALTNPITNTMEPQPPTHPPAGSNAPRQDAKALDSSSAVPQDSSAADPKNAGLPALEGAGDATAASDAGVIAFAARLTPTAELQPPASELSRPAEPPPSSPTSLQTAAPVAAKQFATGADLPADAHSGEGGGQSNQEKASDLFAKPETLLPQIHAGVPDQTAIPAGNHASTSQLSAAAHMDQIIDPSAAPPKTNNDITVRIPDSTGQGTAVRFLERAGEIHVSVRTGDMEMAQSLRGGLNDLVNRLEDGGVRTEVWQPGTDSNAMSSQNDSHQPFADPDGSNGRQHSSGSNSEQEPKQQNKPRWVEELEGSIGNPNLKETTQLLWQA